MGAYTVRWELTVCSALDAGAAAQEALRVMRAQVTGADGASLPVLDCIDGRGTVTRIDLELSGEAGA